MRFQFLKLTSLTIAMMAFTTATMSIGCSTDERRSPMTATEQVASTPVQMAENKPSQSESQSQKEALSPSQAIISEADIAGLKQMANEERLAHDVYITLGEHWQLPVFAKISATEVLHHDAVVQLAQHFGIDATENANVGEFADLDIQALYDSLIAKGMQSETDALLVGMYVEDLDIYDLMALSANTANPDIKSTYDWLTMGSRNHMRGFYRALTEHGATYTPEHISQELYTSIITSPNERGGGQGGGHGHH